MRENRALYREKFAAVVPILSPWLDLPAAAGGFYLWPAVPDDDAAVALSLWSECHLTVLPGSFLARDTGDGNPGRGRIRISLVPELDACVEAARRIADWCRRNGVCTAGSGTVAGDPPAAPGRTADEPHLAAIASTTRARARPNG